MTKSTHTETEDMEIDKANAKPAILTKHRRPRRPCKVIGAVAQAKKMAAGDSTTAYIDNGTSEASMTESPKSSGKSMSLSKYTLDKPDIEDFGRPFGMTHDQQKEQVQIKAKAKADCNCCPLRESCSQSMQDPRGEAAK